LKIDAIAKAKKAEEDEDFAERNKMLKRASKITPEMIEDTKILFDAMGIPYLTAQADGEAQLSVMNAQGKIDGVVTQDFDTLLFGGKDLYRNLTMSGKKKAPGKDYYIQIKPEYISLEENLKALNITREKLVWLGMLVGTDFNNKIPKVGPKTAIKLVTEFDSFEDILKRLEYTPDFDYNEIQNLFMNPPYNPDYGSLKSKDIDFQNLREILIDKYEFNKERVDNTLNSLEKTITERKKQPRLSKWF
jgi:flap endonuclease-1